MYLRRSTITQKQRFIGHVSQLLAGLTHRVTPDRLRNISTSIPKVVILCGDQDHLMNLKHSQELKDAMPEAELVQWENTGHGIQSQRPEKFGELLKEVFSR